MRLRFATLRIGATLAVALVGFGALRVGGRLDGLLAGLALGSWALAFWAGRPRLSSKTWLGLQVSFLVWLALAGVVLGVHVLDLFAQLLVFVQVHRLLTRSAASDDRYVHFIAFGQVLLASVLVFFVVFFNAFQGVREVDRVFVNNARVLGASRLQIVRHVVLPSALTWITASLH
ncbi:MAG: ABC transporter permease subunit, partial [Paracoccus sp. (in: a-proteobacteria)]